MKNNRITVRSFLLGVLFAGILALVSVRGEWTSRVYTTTQIPVLPYVMLFIAIGAINPLLSLARIRFIRRFTSTELMIVFVMSMVSAGVSGVGAVSNMVPMISGMYWEHWNNPDRPWKVAVEPYLDEDYFLGTTNGIRDAAIRLRDIDAEWQKAKRVLTAARSLDNSRREIAAAEETILSVPSGDEEDIRIKRREAVHRRVIAELTLAKAEKWWTKVGDDRDIPTVTNTFPEKIEKLEAEREIAAEQLNELEESAFAAAKTFHDGLPPHLRAVPGFIPIEGEGWNGWWGRYRRYHYGTAALEELEQATEKLSAAGGTGSNVTQEVIAHLDTALEQMALISDTNDLAREKQQVDDKIAQNLLDQQHEEANAKQVYRLRRYAHADDVSVLDERIEESNKKTNELKKRNDELKLELEYRIIPLLDAVNQAAETESSIATVRADLATGATNYAAIRTNLVGQMGEFASFDASSKRFFIGDVDWGMWAKPLMNWMLLIFLTYLVLMTFNILIFKQWAHNEKIIYPLAELPTTLCGAGEESANKGIFAPAFRRGLFWVGVLIPIIVLGWNSWLHPLLPGTNPIKLEWAWQPYIEGSFLHALRSFGRFTIFFTLIGLTFLIPARISYSLWLFHLLYMAQSLLIVWLGYGVDEGSFGFDDSLLLNYRTAEGGGALMVFAMVVLWKCRRNLLCCFWPKALAGLERAERIELSVSSFLFVAGSAGLVAALTIGLGANVFYAALYYLIILIIVIGLTRAVAEGGLLTYKCYFGPFHFVRHMFGMNHSWSAPALMAPLMVFHTVLFTQYKCMIAPAMANALKIRDTLGAEKLRFYIGLAVAILMAFMIGTVAHILLGYQEGAFNIPATWWRWIPVQTGGGYAPGGIQAITLTNPAATAGGRAWLITGAIVMALLLYGRRRVFWLPHPIGLIMFVNPVMHGLWFPILIGWVFKAFVSKYGNKDAYNRLKYLFIGLIVGELIMCILVPSVNLNRN